MDKKELDNLRHTLSHLTAAAVLALYPEAKPTIGPSIEDGFYYDFDNLKISEEDLPKIEKKMRELLLSWGSFESREISANEAKEVYRDNPYKQELIDEITMKGEKITFYKSGDFEDLCRGGHLENPAHEINPQAFKLNKVAGAYWRGLESNKMLTRIYGLAFETKDHLEKHLEMLDKALERDHRKIGKELDLFAFSDLVGAGLPLWTPKGTIVRHLLDNFVWELRQKRGYKKVEIPHITKKDLYEKSGHWAKFSDELFKIKTREGHEFAMKPMNCPHHTQIFARRQWSYRDMPQRYASTTTCYRDEQTGELHGISRTRAFAQDDAHVFCRESQVKAETMKIWDIVEEFYKAFGFELKIRLSIHDPNKMDAYLGDLADWDKVVEEMKNWMIERQADYEPGLGEAAFYGPKIDFMAKDSLGRVWQVATIQADRNMPERFGLSFVNEKGEKEGVVMIHAAIMGSLERFMSVYLEHSGGNFPLWLSPIQIKILPITDKHASFAEETANSLEEKGFRIEIDNASDPLGRKISKAKSEKTPYYMVIGDKEMDSGILKIESREGVAKELDFETLLEDLKMEVKRKK